MKYVCNADCNLFTFGIRINLLAEILCIVWTFHYAWIQLQLQKVQKSNDESFLFLKSRMMIKFHAPQFPLHTFPQFWWIKYYGISILQLAIRILYPIIHFRLVYFIEKFTFTFTCAMVHDPWYTYIQWDASVFFLPESTIIIKDTEKYFNEFRSLFSLPSENERPREFELSNSPLKYYCDRTINGTFPNEFRY